MAKKWPVVDFNLAKALDGKIKTERVQIPKTLQIQIIIELDDELYKQLAKDPTWLAKVQSESKKKADDVVADLAKIINRAETKAVKFDEKTAKIFTNDLTDQLDKQLKLAGKEMADYVVKLFEDYKKGKKDLTKFRIKSGAKITLTAVVITASAAAAGATYGALSPLAIVGIVRGGVTIAQECAKLASTADQVGKLVQGELKILKQFMKKSLEDASTKDKLLQGGKEIGLNVVSKILGVESPSMKNCETHIQLHHVNITKLEKEAKRFSKKINPAMDEQEKWSKTFDKAKQSMPSDKVGKIRTNLSKVEKALNKIIEVTIKLNESVEKAKSRQEKFELALNAMKQGIPKWVGYVDVAVGLGMDIGMACADASNVAEGILGTVISIETVIAGELIDAA